MRKLRIEMLLVIGLALSFAAAQDRPSTEPPPQDISVSPDEDYRIGPHDMVEVYILRVPELSRQYRVTADGKIEIPFLGKVKAQEKTSEELAATIADGLRGDYLVDPQVSVIVQQINRRFFIQGAVHVPGVYNIEGRPSLIQLITIAGGLNPTYGSTAFIFHNVRRSKPESQDTAESASEPEVKPEYELRKANINALLRGDFKENVAVEAGDLIHIPPADVFFVAGEVKSPGSFPLKEGTTVRQAISLAQGTNSIASPTRAVIFRENASGQKLEVPVDVKAVMSGRNPDVPVMPNDIIVIPNSRTKSVFVPVVNAFGLSAAYVPARIVP